MMIRVTGSVALAAANHWPSVVQGPLACAITATAVPLALAVLARAIGSQWHWLSAEYNSTFYVLF